MFTYSANVKCINAADTWIEFMFTDYVGTLSEDIEAISIIGPSGLITDNLNDFRVYDGIYYLLYQMNSVPELGVYTLSATIGGETVENTDTQTINRTVPIVDDQTIIPAPDDAVPVDTKFEWTAVADPGYDVYYGIQIRDESGNYVVNYRWVDNFEYNVTLDPGNYTWQIIVVDGSGTWVSVDNRTHGNWNSFSIT